MDPCRQRGRIFVALRFIESLRRALPSASFLLTTTTSTGHRVAAERLDRRDLLLYFPTDFPWVVRRALRTLRPQALILTESELWPNLIRMAKRSGVPVMLVNGRISQSSYRGYRRIRMFMGPVLKCFDALLVQSETDRERLLDLGADPAAVFTPGSAKYDVSLGAPPIKDITPVLASFGIEPEDPILLGGSTWAGEEAALLDAYTHLRQRFDSLRLILVPRHAERRAEVIAEISRRGLTHACRSGASAAPGSGPVDVLLVDTTGELRDFYAAATVIFVGKSLTQNGGQNVIEPAALAKPIVVGPNMQNFPVVIDDFLGAKAMVQVAGAADFEDALACFLADPDLRDQCGQRAAAVVQSHAGAIERSVRRLLPFIQSSSRGNAA